MKHASLIEKIGTIRSVSEGTKSEQDSGLLRNHNRKRMLRVVNIKIKKILKTSPFLLRKNFLDTNFINVFQRSFVTITIEKGYLQV